MAGSLQSEPTAPAELEFWFEFASTYSYPAAERVVAAAVEAGAVLRWMPFLLGPIFAAQGWKDSPFNLYPAKGAYMWRDLERLCAAQGLPFQRPSVFPRGGLLAARVATAVSALSSPSIWADSSGNFRAFSLLMKLTTISLPWDSLS